MATADQYRVKAAEFRARAADEAKPLLRRSLEMLARVYIRLAEQADRNSQTDVTYGSILPPSSRESERKAP